MAKIRMKIAKPGRRFGAACIDGAIPVILYIILMIAAAKRHSYSYYGFNGGYGYGYYEQSGGSSAVMAIAGLLLLAYLVVECVFYAKAASIGKKLLGLQVVSSLDGKPLGFWRMLYRECIVKQASNVLLLGYIWILVDERHRAWHDKIMDTYVVDMKASGLIGVKNAPAPAPAAAPPANGAPAAAPSPAPAVPAQTKPAPAVKGAPVSVAPAPTPAPTPAPEAIPAVAPAPASAIPQRPTIRLDLDEETTAAGPAVAYDIDIEPAAPAEVKADMSMKKDELLEAAARLGVSVNARMTKAEIIEAVNKASEQ